MGYNTRYSLSVTLMIGIHPAKLVDEAPLNAVIEDLRNSHENAAYALTEDGSGNDSCKWYEHETELKEFSKRNPSILFTLHGEGEENEDVWNKYFLNGKVQVAKAQFQIAPFNPKELK